MKKKLGVAFAIIFAFYVIGFFFSVPIMLKSRYLLIRGPIESIITVFYIDVVKFLGREHFISKIWNANTIYWCERDDQCEVVYGPEDSKEDKADNPLEKSK